MAIVRIRPGRSFRSSPGVKSMFSVSGTLFNSQEIIDLIGRKAAGAFNKIGRLIKRRAKKSLKLGRRIGDISKIADKEFRQSFHIKMSRFRRGERGSPPLLPFIPSKPGGIPKLRSKGSPLKRRILHKYDRVSKSVVVGPQKLPGSKSVAPRVLEHGGVSNSSKVAQRPYMSRALNAARKSGQIKAVFNRNIRL